MKSQAPESGCDEAKIADAGEMDGLYVTDAEIIQRLNVPEKLGYRAIHDLEKQVPGRPKFPGYDPLFPRRRFWPAVQKYFMLRHGVTDQPFMAAPQWQETKDATAQAGEPGRNRDARPQVEGSRDTLEGLLVAAAGHRRTRLPHKKPTLVASRERSDSDA